MLAVREALDEPKDEQRKDMGWLGAIESNQPMCSWKPLERTERSKARTNLNPHGP